MRREFFTNVMKKLEYHFPGQLAFTGQEMLQSWYDVLSFYSEEALAAAVLKIIRTLKAFPSVAHIEEFIKDATQGSWEQAYEECRHKAHYFRYPEYDPQGNIVDPDFKDPIALKTLKAIGPNAFLDCPTDQINTFRAQFRSAYESQQKQKELDFYKQMSVGGKDSIAMLFIEGRSDELASLVDKLSLNKSLDGNQGLLGDAT